MWFLCNVESLRAFRAHTQILKPTPPLVMTCCLMAQSYCPIQCWLIISRSFGTNVNYFVCEMLLLWMLKLYWKIILWKVNYSVVLLSWWCGQFSKKNPHNRHPIAHPWGDVRCHLWVLSLTDVLFLALWYCINGSVQDCSISIANELEILQSCSKPLVCINTEPHSMTPNVMLPTTINSQLCYPQPLTLPMPGLEFSGETKSTSLLMPWLQDLPDHPQPW